MASIEEVMRENPNWRDYYNAAIYYRESNRDLEKAKEWMAKAIELDGGNILFTDNKRSFLLL